MIFERTESGNFTINGNIISKQIFLDLEPSYSEPEGTIFVHYQQGEGRKIRTTTKEYRVPGVWVDGDRYIQRLSHFVSVVKSDAIEQQGLEKEITEARIESMNNHDRRKLEYPPLEDLVVALWENLVEKKTKKVSGVEEIQKIRNAIKNKYPIGNQQDAISKNKTEVD
jgi:hypothetical protein